MLFLCLSIALLLYCIALSVYRLRLSPISKFPGPKITALTWLYEFYYDHGQFYKEIERLHSIYGPIIRINPDEIHVKDPDWYNELYTSSTRTRDKSYWFVGRTGGGSMFSTVNHALHRKRRSALNPFFSKKAVVELEPVIQGKVDRLCERMQDQIDDIVEMGTAYFALTFDIISDYAFGETYGCLDREDFGAEQKEMLLAATESNITGRHLPWIPDVMMMLPESLAARLSKPIAFFFKLQKNIKSKVEVVSSRERGEIKSSRTIFEELLYSNLPPEEKTVQRLVDEGVTMIGAGAETSAHTLATLTFHLLNTPQVHRTLVAELDEAIPDPSNPPTWHELEQLPYLVSVFPDISPPRITDAAKKATILEAHRITAIITTRLIRVAPNEVLQYKDWTIPPGIPVGMTTHWTQHDPNIFPEPLQFKPERFLGDYPEPEKYVLPFSKGSRSCIGLNLATAELYLTVANMFRRFEFELYDTTYKDVKITWDMFSAGVNPESNGVRVKVLGMRP